MSLISGRRPSGRLKARRLTANIYPNKTALDNYNYPKTEARQDPFALDRSHDH